MKKYLSKLLFLIVLFIGSSFTASAQIYVNVRPPVPEIVVTPRPTPEHVWIREEWEPSGTEYRFVGGHWAVPPHRGYVWREGHWSDRHGRHAWVPGHWKKRR